MSKRKVFVVPLKSSKSLKCEEKNNENVQEITESILSNNEQSQSTNNIPSTESSIQKFNKNESAINPNFQENVKTTESDININITKDKELPKCREPAKNKKPYCRKSKSTEITGKKETVKRPKKNYDLTTQKKNIKKSFPTMNSEQYIPEILPLDSNVNYKMPSYVDDGLQNYSNINNDNQYIESNQYEQNFVKDQSYFTDDKNNYNVNENYCNLFKNSEDIDKDPFEIMVNAFVNINTNTEVTQNERSNFFENSIDDCSPDLLDISCNTGQYFTMVGPWDYDSSQDSIKSDFLEEDQDNRKLLQDILRRGKLNSEWHVPPKSLPKEERIKVQKESENSIITLAKARQEQIDQESNIIEIISEDKVESSTLPSALEQEEIELEKDRKCEEIAKCNNMIWRRPVKEKPDQEMLKGPVVNPPPPSQRILITYTPGGQKYKIDMMEGRPTKFKNVDAMMMWDIASKMNMQRMISQIEDGSFFPSSLDYEKEKKFKQHIASQKKRLAKWMSVVSWDDLENDLNFLLSEKELITTDHLIKKWRPELSQIDAIEFIENLENIEINQQILLKNPQILTTLFKLITMESKSISEKASALLEKYKALFNTSSNLFDESFKESLNKYNKAKGHLRHLYQEMLISSKFHYVASEEEYCRIKNEQVSQVVLPPDTFNWD